MDALNEFKCLIENKGKDPIPLDVWEVFKVFSLTEVVSKDDFLMVQVGDSDVMEDSYLDFCRELSFSDDEGDSWRKQLHAEFKCQLPAKLGFDAVDCLSDEFSNLNDFFNAVEFMPEFQAALTFQGWAFELYFEDV